MGKIQVLVGTSDIDQMHHLNNQKYVAFLEKGRDDLYQSANLSDVQLKARGFGRAVAKMTIEFQKEVKLGERLEVVTYPIAIGRSSFTLKQEIYNERQEIVNQAVVISVFIDFAKRTSTPMPADFRQFLERALANGK